MKKLISKLLISIATILMVHSCDFIYLEDVENCTNEPLYFGFSRSDNIGKAKFHFKYDSLCIKTKHVNKKYNLNTNGYITLPGERSGYNSKRLLGKHRMGYIFAIKEQTVKNHSWEEICNDSLYDKLVVKKMKKGMFCSICFQIKYKGSLENGTFLDTTRYNLGKVELLH